MIRRKLLVERIIFSIDKKANCTNKISKKVNIIYTHVVRVLGLLEKEGIVDRSKSNGRTRLVSLTQKGQRIRNAYIELDEAYSQSINKASYTSSTKRTHRKCDDKYFDKLNNVKDS